MKLLAQAIGQVLVKKATKSVTSWIGAAGIAAGGYAVVDPKVLELIPEQYRGWVGVAVGGVVLLARNRAAIFETYAKLRAELRAAIEKAEREVAPSPPTDTH